ncbi:hypothetical protein Ais01nite_74660 [Asanoa ishikariensis]|nr:hypothetical protein [Asanoa ishikariensis]GIF69431.1 hypothetical protein Ais01nite_74660 [Asanoa ishikariensis]
MRAQDELVRDVGKQLLEQLPPFGERRRKQRLVTGGEQIEDDVVRGKLACKLECPLPGRGTAL